MERTELDLEGIDINALKDAFTEMLKRIEVIERQVPPQEIERDTFSVQEKIFTIRQKLITSKRTTFRQLFEEAATKIEIIVTFLALLELSRHGRVNVSQGSNEEGIIIEAREDSDEDINENE